MYHFLRFIPNTMFSFFSLWILRVFLPFPFGSILNMVHMLSLLPILSGKAKMPDYFSTDTRGMSEQNSDSGFFCSCFFDISLYQYPKKGFCVWYMNTKMGEKRKLREVVCWENNRSLVCCCSFCRMFLFFSQKQQFMYFFFSNGYFAGYAPANFNSLFGLTSLF